MIRKKTDFDPINGNIERVGCLKNFHDLMSIEDRNAVLKKFFRIDVLIDKKIKINALYAHRQEQELFLIKGDILVE